MANRYKNITPFKRKDGTRVYKSKVYPNIPKSDTDIYVVSQTTDRLDTIAYQFYGDSTLWWIIAAANNIHDAPLGLKDGTILRIPENYLQIINEFES